MEEGKDGQVGETEDGQWAGGQERIFVFSLKPQPEEEKGVGSRDRNREGNRESDGRERISEFVDK